MWATLGKWAANALLIPFFKWLAVNARYFAVRKYSEWKLKRENAKKVEANRNSSGKDDSRDTFGRLP
jgi:hypothetical protein